MNTTGRINVYTCRTCGDERITIDIDKGVTPMLLDCLKCGGDAVSAWYRVDQALNPEWEWYRPTKRQIKRMPKGWRHHYEQGGLDLRKRDGVRQ